MSKRTQITGRLDAYVDAQWLRDSDVKRWLRDETAKLPGGVMQVAADQGQIMALLARAIGARVAVEVGTFTGYSALCVAEARCKAFTFRRWSTRSGGGRGTPARDVWHTQCWVKSAHGSAVKGDATLTSGTIPGR